MLKTKSLSDEIMDRINYWHEQREILSKWLYTGYYQEEFFGYHKVSWLAHKLDLLLLASMFELGDMSVHLPDCNDIAYIYSSSETEDCGMDALLDMGGEFFDSLPEKISHFGWNVYCGYGTDMEYDLAFYSVTNYRDEILSLLDKNIVKDLEGSYAMGYIFCRNEDLMSFVKNDTSLMNELEDAFRKTEQYLLAQCDFSVFGGTPRKITNYVTKSECSYVLGAAYSTEEVCSYGYFFMLETYIILSVIDRWVSSGGKEVPEWKKI